MKITRNPKLSRIRDNIIQGLKNGKVHVLVNGGLFNYEIGEIFRLQEARISQILSSTEKIKVDSGKRIKGK